MSRIEQETNFRDIVERSFEPFTRRHGFRVRTAAYDPQDFGNTVVVLESDDWSIRVVRDRGQLFFDVASIADPRNWLPLGRVLDVAAGGGHHPGGTSAIELGVAVELIGTNYSKLVECLGPLRYAETRREVERLGELAKKRFVSKPKPC